MLEIAGGILLAILILVLAPLLLGATVGVAFAAQAGTPYLLLTALGVWAANQVPGLREAWAWGLLGAVGAGFLVVKARERLSARRHAPWEWHQGHFAGLGVVLLIGIPLLSYFHIRTAADIRREAGYDNGKHGK